MTDSTPASRHGSIAAVSDELSPPTRFALGVLKVVALMALGAAVGDIVRWLT